MSILKFHTCTSAAMLALAGVGIMQGAAEQGTFHLTQQIVWGHVVLQPGDYKLYVPDAPLDEANVRVEGNGKTVFELPFVANTGAVTDSSYLKLTNVGGTYYVTEYAAGSVGKTFEFNPPKPAHRLQQAGASGMSSQIAVTKQ